MKSIILALLVCATRATPLPDLQEETVETKETPSYNLHSEFSAEGTTKVAFSVSSGYQGTYGPFNTEVSMIFKNVITNVGSAYSTNTGIFRAPVKGVYHFSVSVFGNTNTYVEVYLVKNDQRIFGLSESPKGSNMSISRAINLLLEQGDEVYLKLCKGCQVYDDGQTYNTFSGFLLFPM